MAGLTPAGDEGAGGGARSSAVIRGLWLVVALYFVARPGLFLLGPEHEFQYLAGDDGRGAVLFAELWLLSLGAAGVALVAGLTASRAPSRGWPAPVFVGLFVALLECALAILDHANALALDATF